MIQLRQQTYGINTRGRPRVSSILSSKTDIGDIEELKLTCYSSFDVPTNLANEFWRHPTFTIIHLENLTAISKPGKPNLTLGYDVLPYGCDEG
jgi:hypothetical protein